MIFYRPGLKLFSSNIFRMVLVPKKSTPGKFAYIWLFQEIGMSATKFEQTRIHFKSDFFAAVAVVDAKALY